MAHVYHLCHHYCLRAMSAHGAPADGRAASRALSHAHSLGSLASGGAAGGSGGGVGDTAGGRASNAGGLVTARSTSSLGLPSRRSRTALGASNRASHLSRVSSAAAASGARASLGTGRLPPPSPVTARSAPAASAGSHSASKAGSRRSRRSDRESLPSLTRRSTVAGTGSRGQAFGGSRHRGSNAAASTAVSQSTGASAGSRRGGSAAAGGAAGGSAASAASEHNLHYKASHELRSRRAQLLNIKDKISNYCVTKFRNVPELYMAMDLDRDGKISMSDWLHGRELFNLPITQAEAKAMVSHVRLHVGPALLVAVLLQLAVDCSGHNLQCA